MNSHMLSPTRFAQSLGITESTLAQLLNVDLETLQCHPSEVLVQQRLSQFVRVFEMLLTLQRDAEQAATQMKNAQIRVLENRTLVTTIRDGNFEKAFRYLQTIASGQNG